MIACSKADLIEDPEEKRVIKQILEETFDISGSTTDRLLEFADTASEGEYLGEITILINEQFNDRDKRFILEKLWRVAYADGRIENQEREFIDRIAGEINLSEEDVNTARTLAQHLI